MALIRAEQLIAEYVPGIPILQGLDFEAAEGQFTCIIGPNGAGKSTLLKCLAGFLVPRSGQVWYGDRDITREPTERRIYDGIAIVPQQTRSLFPDMSVHENLELGCWVFRKDKARTRRAIERVYERFAFLADRRHEPAGLLSGGQQRILELQRALMFEPQVLLLDEPTETLAPAIANQIYDHLLELKGTGLTLIMVDQNVRKAVEIADYLYVLEMGRTSLHGAQADLSDEMGNIIRDWLAIEREGEQSAAQAANVNEPQGGK